MNRITINGNTFEVSGNNISVSGNSIIVDGITIQSNLNGIVEIKFEGDLANVEAHNVKVTGNVMGDVDAHNVECKNVGGNVKAHNVDCGDIQGNVNAKNLSR